MHNPRIRLGATPHIILTPPTRVHTLLQAPMAYGQLWSASERGITKRSVIVCPPGLTGLAAPRRCAQSTASGLPARLGPGLQHRLVYRRQPRRPQRAAQPAVTGSVGHRGVEFHRFPDAPSDCGLRCPP
jgi:hypothetical protein